MLVIHHPAPILQLFLHPPPAVVRKLHGDPLHLVAQIQVVLYRWHHLLPAIEPRPAHLTQLTQPLDR